MLRDPVSADGAPARHPLKALAKAIIQHENEIEYRPLGAGARLRDYEDVVDDELPFEEVVDLFTRLAWLHDVSALDGTLRSMVFALQRSKQVYGSHVTGSLQREFASIAKEDAWLRGFHPTASSPSRPWRGRTQDLGEAVCVRLPLGEGMHSQSRLEDEIQNSVSSSAKICSVFSSEGYDGWRQLPTCTTLAPTSSSLATLGSLSSLSASLSAWQISQSQWYTEFENESSFLLRAAVDQLFRHLRLSELDMVVLIVERARSHILQL